MELAVARARPRDHWRRIRFVADAARAFVDGGGTSLRGFVTWLAHQVDEDARAVELVVPEPDDDAVRILTVHGAKGLEFPVVVLAGLGVADRNVAPPVLWDPDGCPQIQIGPRERNTTAFRYRSPRYEALSAHERAAVRGRADPAALRGGHPGARLPRREHAPPGQPGLPRVAPPHPGGPGTRSLAARRRSRRARSPPALAPGPEPVDADDGEYWLATRHRQIAAGRRRPVAAATALAHLVAARTAEEAELPGPIRTWPSPSPTPTVRPIGGAAAAPQSAARFTPSSRPSTSLPATDSTPPRGRRRSPKASRSGKWRSATSRRRPCGRRSCAPAIDAGWPRWREVPVAALVDGVLVEGFIDLLVETPDGLVVVDYKTDQLPTDADLDSAVGRYAIQGAAYALALEAALGRPVADCVFVFARAPEPAQRAVPDLEAAKARVWSICPSSPLGSVTPCPRCVSTTWNSPSRAARSTRRFARRSPTSMAMCSGGRRAMWKWWGRTACTSTSTMGSSYSWPSPTSRCSLRATTTSVCCSTLRRGRRHPGQDPGARRNRRSHPDQELRRPRARPGHGARVLREPPRRAGRRRTSSPPRRAAPGKVQPTGLRRLDVGAFADEEETRGDGLSERPAHGGRDKVAAQGGVQHVEKARAAVSHRRQVEDVVGGVPGPAAGDRLSRLDGASGCRRTCRARRGPSRGRLGRLCGPGDHVGDHARERPGALVGLALAPCATTHGPDPLDGRRRRVPGPPPRRGPRPRARRGCRRPPGRRPDAAERCTSDPASP